MEVTLRNEHGQDFALQNNADSYQLISISGLDPVRAQLNLTPIVGQDGSQFTSAKLNNRNIVVMLALTGDTEQRRLQLYSDFRPKSKIRVFIKTNMRDVYIDGVVEYITCNIFDRNIRAQISIICPDPWFLDRQLPWVDQPEDLADGVAFRVNNTGDAPVPFTLGYRRRGALTGFEVYAGGELLTILEYTASEPDITLDTGAKTIESAGVDLVPFLTTDSVFQTLPIGESTVRLTVFGPSISAQEQESFLFWRNRYGGV